MTTINSVNQNFNVVQNRQANNNQNVAFRGTAPDLDSLRAKQDEFLRMSEQSGNSNSWMGKIGKFASKAIGVVIAFTAMKICLGKASDMITGYLGKGTDKIIEKTAEKSADKAASMTKYVDKIKAWNLDKKVVNLVAGGAALGVALKDFGIVKKPVSDATDDLVDKAVDKANGNSYNGYTGSYTDDDEV